MPAFAEEKLEHLARWVLDRFDTQADRAVWLRDEYESRHGKAATEALKTRMLRIHRERRAGRAS